jgi:hypothetical protein
MAALNDAKTVGAPFGNESTLKVVTYDFSVDGGAVADYDVITADGSILVELINVDVETAVTSAGSLVADLGKGAGGTEFWSDQAVAGMTIDAQLLPDTPGTIVELADTEKLIFGIEVAAATAGKAHFMFRIYRRPKQ